MIDERLVALYEIIEAKDGEIAELREQIQRLIVAIRDGNPQAVYREYGRVLATTILTERSKGKPWTGGRDADTHAGDNTAAIQAKGASKPANHSAP